MNPKNYFARCFWTISLLCLSWPVAARAFDSVGHMAVAGLAFDELSEAQQTKLVAILKKHPKVNFITDGFPDGNPEDRDFVMAAATWPDLARAKTSKKTPESDRIKDVGYEEDKPAVEKVDHTDRILHRGWHFIDTPLWVGNGAAPPLPATPAVNAVGVVNVLMKQLKSDEGDEERAYDLAWLMHLVGDLHQPLHAVNGITDTLPDGDKGGNRVLVTGVNQGASELHAFWDNLLGKPAGADRTTHRPRLDKDAAAADEVIDSVQKLRLRKTAENLDPAVWARESFDIAKRDAYDLQLEPITIERPGKDPVEELTTELADKYGATAKRDAQKQVRLAGHRLALLLQQVLH